MKLYLLIGMSVAVILFHRSFINFDNSDVDLHYHPPLALKHFSFGYQEVMSDSYWLRLIQDFDYCGQPAPTSSLNPKGRKVGRNRTPTCSKGWGFHMLNLITELTPENRVPNQLGPLTLSVIADDIDGATILFEKAMRNFPLDWVIHFQAGYHFLLELEDKQKALDCLKIASENGGPEYLPLLIARLYDNLGSKYLAKSVLTQYLKRTDLSDKNKERAQEKLNSLEEEENK